MRNFSVSDVSEGDGTVVNALGNKEWDQLRELGNINFIVFVIL